MKADHCIYRYANTRLLVNAIFVFPQAPKKPEVATVISPFPASDAREISLSPGQLIHILKKDQGGWWQGELQVFIK